MQDLPISPVTFTYAELQKKGAVPKTKRIVKSKVYSSQEIVTTMLMSAFTSLLLFLCFAAISWLPPLVSFHPGFLPFFHNLPGVA